MSLYRLQIELQNKIIRPAYYANSKAEAMAKGLRDNPQADEVKVLAELDKTTDDWGYDYEA